MNYVILIMSLVITVPAISYAQDAIPVMDIQLKNELESQAEDQMRQAINLLLIQGRVRRTNEAVEDTRMLQEQYRNFLRQTTSTANLAWMNNQQTQKQLDWVTAADGHLDDYGFAGQLAQLHAAQMEPGQKSQLLYEGLTPFDETQVFTSLEAFNQDQRQRQLHRGSLRQMQQRRQLQLARLKQIRAGSAQQESQELTSQLLRRNRVSTPGVATPGVATPGVATPGFSMTEAERLQLLARVEAGFTQSQRAQLKADALMQQSNTYSFSKAYLLNRYHQQHMRQSVGSTQLFSR